MMRIVGEKRIDSLSESLSRVQAASSRQASIILDKEVIETRDQVIIN